MAKWLRRVLVIILVAWLLSYTPFGCPDRVIIGIYTVIGIMFPIALSQIMSFSFANIENDNFVLRYRKQLSYIRTVFIVLFSLATIIFILSPFPLKISWKILKFDLQNLFLFYYISCLYYFVRNFISLAVLKDEIDDAIRKNINQHNNL
jgi:hypothetical protein